MKFKTFFSHSMLVTIGLSCFLFTSYLRAAVPQNQHISQRYQTGKKFYLILSSSLQNTLFDLSLIDPVSYMQPYLIFLDTKANPHVRIWNSSRSRIAIPFAATSIKLFIPTLHGTKEFIFTEDSIENIKQLPKRGNAYSVSITNDEANTQSRCCIDNIVSVHEQKSNPYLKTESSRSIVSQAKDLDEQIPTSGQEEETPAQTEDQLANDADWLQYCVPKEDAFLSLLPAPMDVSPDAQTLENLLTT